MILHPRHRLSFARARAGELRHDAAGATGPGDWLAQPGVNPADLSIVIRPALPEDQHALARLAGLDSASVPAAPLLVAEVGGELRAARSLHDGAVIADPFQRTASLVALLALRAGQLQLRSAVGGGLFGRLRRGEDRVRRSNLPARF
jgi:hypothetical protein